MQPGALGERLLTQPFSCSQLANCTTECGRKDSGIGAWHMPTLCTEMTMSLQPMSIINRKGTGGGLREAEQSGRDEGMFEGSDRRSREELG